MESSIGDPSIAGTWLEIKINNIEKTGRGSLLLKIQREDQSLWVTIKFVK